MERRIINIVMAIVLAAGLNVPCSAAFATQPEPSGTPASESPALPSNSDTSSLSMESSTAASSSSVTIALSEDGDASATSDIQNETETSSIEQPVAAADTEIDGAVENPRVEKVDDPQEGIDYVQGRVVVTYKNDAAADDATEDGVLEVVTDINVVATDTASGQDVALQGAQVQAKAPINEVLDADGSTTTVVAETPDNMSVAQTVAALSEDPRIESVEPDYKLQFMEDDMVEASSLVNDPYADASYSWYLNAINAGGAWNQVTSDGQVNVAVLDSGCNMNHPDLVDNIVASYDATTSSGGPVLGDGSSSGHGTHVAGIIAGTSNNGLGVSGVSYNAGIIPINVMEYDYPTFSCVVKAFRWLINDGNAQKYNVRVINMCFGDTGVEAITSSNTLAKLIDRANEMGIVTVCAAGNSGSVTTSKFADYPTTVGVMSLQSNDTLTPSSTRSENMDISAPGSSVYSTSSNGSYCLKSGTSCSTPIVSGTLALEFAANPDLTADQAKEILYASATPLSNVAYGNGKVNAAAAVNMAMGGELAGSTVDIDEAVITLQADTFTYTGEAIEPAIESVTVGDKHLDAATDYAVAYKDNEGVGTATVTVQGQNAYQGTASTQFVIQANTDIASAAISGINESYSYTGRAICPQVSVRVAGMDKPLALGPDYTVSYGTNTQVGTGTVTIKGAGDYIGSVTKEFAICSRNISACSITGINASYTYTGAAINPSVEVMDSTGQGIRTLRQGTDYTVSYGANTQVGTGTVTIKGCGSYTGTVNKEFLISANSPTSGVTEGSSGTKDISAAEASVPSQPYSGAANTPAPTVILDGKTLTSGTDYTVSYANNANAGTAMVTITGKGNYSGTKQTSFTITPKDISGATVSSIPAVAYTGKAWTPNLTVALGGKNLSNGSDYTVSYGNNTNTGTATVAIAGKGNYGGSKTVNFRIVDILSYTTHVQNVGWQNYGGSGTMAGTSGRGLRLEGIKIKTDVASLGLSGGITYQTHVQNIGWQSEVSNNALSGTSGRSLRLEAIKIRLTGQLGLQYDVYYRVHAQDVGWMGWAKNGEAAGTAGYSKRLEGIQIVLVPKNSGAPATTYRGITSVDTHPCIDASATNGVANYNATMHIQNKGNTNFSTSGSKSLGTTGSSLRVEALTITNFNAPAGTNLGVKYRTHIQNMGWQDWKTTGQMSGTSGRALRLEALQLELTGADKGKYDIYYRTHVQNIGWTGWAKNGQQCGSAGYGYRMEAMQIVVVPKWESAPGINSGFFYQR